MVFSPLVRILLGLSLIILSSALDVFPLALAACAMSVWLCIYQRVDGFRWLRRARYLIIIPFIVNGYTIAGTGLLPWGIWVPTWEGLQVGLLQSLRLVIALFVIRIAFHGLSSNETLRGFIAMLAPLKWCGVDTNQIAKRLQLTMYYLNRVDGLSARELLRGMQRIH